MRNLQKLILVCFVFTFVVNPIHSQSWEWTSKIGSTSADVSESAAIDKMGNIFVAGKFKNSITLDSNNITSSGDYDIFVAKFDSQGNNLWLKSAGGTLKDEGLAVHCDLAGNVVVTGFFKVQASFDSTIIYGPNTENFFIAKYSGSGNLIYVKNAIGPGKSIGKGIEFDKMGNALATGYYKDTCIFGTDTLISPAESNVFLVKYDPIGNLLWANYGGGNYDAWASSVSIDSYCNSYITGSFKDTADFGNNQMITNGGNDVFLVKCDSAGNWLWAKNGGGNNNDYGNGMRVDPLNNIAVTGSFFDTVSFPPAQPLITNGSKDGFIAYYNPQGDCMWIKTMGGLQQDKGIDCVGDKDGNIYVTGFVNGISQFNSIVDTTVGGDDIFIAKYDNSGNIIYADLAGSSAADYGKGIALSQQGIVYVTGDFRATSYFSNDTIISNGDRDAFLSKYYDGSPVFVSQPSNLNVCVGDTVTLSVQLTGPAPFSYLWFDDAGSILGAVNSSYTFTASDTNYSGKYYCMVNNVNAFVTSDTALLTVHSLPVVDLGPDTNMQLNYSIIIDAGAGFISYQWSTTDTTQSIEVLLSSVILGDTMYSVIVTDSNGCINSDTIIIYTFIDGIDENKNIYTQCYIYPNPATENITIKMNNDIKSLQLINLIGQVIMEKQVNTNEIKVTLSGIEPGLYFLKMKVENGIITRKITIGK